MRFCPIVDIGPAAAMTWRGGSTASTDSVFPPVDLSAMPAAFDRNEIRQGRVRPCRWWPPPIRSGVRAKQWTDLLGQAMQLFQSETVRHAGPVDRGDQVVHAQKLVEPIELIRDFPRRAKEEAVLQ